MSYKNKFKKELFNKISLLDKIEHEEIYKILIENSPEINLTTNANGIFFNLSSLNDELITKINLFVDFCIKNKKNLDDYDKKLIEYKNNKTIRINFNDIEKNKKDKKIEDWNKSLDNNLIQKVNKYIEYVINDNENIYKKKTNNNFNTAKKKYSKPYILNDVNLKNILKKEKYI